MEESSVYQAILARGEARGEARGKAIGEAIGEATGLLAEARRSLLLIGEDSLGPADASTRTALEAIGEVQRLEELLLRVKHVHSWPELLRTPKPRTRRTRRT